MVYVTTTYVGSTAHSGLLPRSGQIACVLVALCDHPTMDTRTPVIREMLSCGLLYGEIVRFVARVIGADGRTTLLFFTSVRLWLLWFYNISQRS